MIFKEWHKWVMFLVVAIAPIITLLVRGLVWGADSFAYWGVSCGNNSIVQYIHSPSWFVWFLQNVINCNFYTLVLFQFIAYLAILFSIWLIGKRFFNKEDAWRLPIYCGSICQLFFIEVLRFEHELYGICLAFVAVGLFSLFLATPKLRNKAALTFFVVISAIFAYILWNPSVLIVVLCFFLWCRRMLVQKIGLISLIIVFLFFEWGYLLGSFNFVNIVSEELPFVGLIFVFYLLPFWKNIPKELKWYSLFLIAFGTLKSKYMFLATPLLCIGILDKQLETGIVLKRQIFGIKEIPILYICGILLIGWCLMGLSLYPTQLDVREAQQAIRLAHDKNDILYNDWGDGWLFVSLGYDTDYKISPPRPDWNDLPKPFIAWSSQDLNYLCTKISTRTYQC